MSTTASIPSVEQGAGKGRIIWISGPVVKAELPGARMYELVFVGELGLFGEVVRIQGDIAFIQVYEDTTGIRPGEPVVRSGEPLCAWLGPGIMMNVYDGVQRPLKLIYESSARPFIARGIGYDKAPPLDFKRKWKFVPKVKQGEEVEPGDILGVVQETALIEHRIMYPPLPENRPGKVKYIAPEGEYTIDDVIAEIETKEGVVKVKMWHKWPVRRPRPVVEKLPPVEPFLTNIRILDTLFPIAKGGTAAIPGPFGTGKTVTIQSLMKYSAARICFPVLCGERGNEAADSLHSMLRLTDPETGRPLMERTCIIVNTSNMPVAAREASIYMGITLSEYYRDMGYDVLLVADSTSRWAEAMREVALRIGEMPSEEGFPAYLPTRIAEFYERAGRCILIGREKRVGSVTICASVSPPGGDFTEPVTSHTIRFVSCFWPLSARIAAQRHYPAFDWLSAFSKYIDTVQEWWHKNVGPDWRQLRDTMMELLVREAELMEIVRILGTEALSEYERHILNTAYMIREGFLKQDAFHPIDCRSPPPKTYLLMKIIVEVYWRKGLEAVKRGVPASALREMETARRLPRLRMEVSEKELDKLKQFYEEMSKEIDKLVEQYSKR